jgi:hypothetical protein
MVSSSSHTRGARRGYRCSTRRWNGSGDRIHAVTRDRRLLTLDSATGALIREGTIPVSGTPGQDRLIAAALDAEATIEAYSMIRLSSDLYLASGIR